MRFYIPLLISLSALTACNFKENLKEVGDGVQTGVQNAGEAVKETASGVSKASNKVEEGIRK